MPTPTTLLGDQPPINVPGAYNVANPDQVIREFMREHGIDPSRRSGFGDFVQGLMSKIVPVLFQNMYSGTSPDGSPSMALDQIGNPMGMLNNIFASGTGNLGANLKGFADNALQQFQGDPSMLNLASSQAQRRFIDLNALQTYGMNPYESLASQGALDEALAGYEDRKYQQAHGQTVANPNQTLAEYIFQNAGNVLGLQPRYTGAVPGSRGGGIGGNNFR
jgi:hypothetical protein